jgi:hypothetical protein
LEIDTTRAYWLDRRIAQSRRLGLTLGPPKVWVLFLPSTCDVPSHMSSPTHQRTLISIRSLKTCPHENLSCKFVSCFDDGIQRVTPSLFPPSRDSLSHLGGCPLLPAYHYSEWCRSPLSRISHHLLRILRKDNHHFVDALILARRKNSSDDLPLQPKWLRAFRQPFKDMCPVEE